MFISDTAARGVVKLSRLQILTLIEKIWAAQRNNSY